MPDSVNLFELFWTVSSTLGAVLAAGLCLDVAGDAGAIRRDGSNGIRKKATYLCLAITAVFVFTLLVFAVIGGIAMTQTQPPSEDRATTTQYAVTVGFGLVNVLMVAVLTYWRIVRYYARKVGLPATETTIAGGVHGLTQEDKRS